MNVDGKVIHRLFAIDVASIEHRFRFLAPFVAVFDKKKSWIFESEAISTHDDGVKEK